MACHDIFVLFLWCLTHQNENLWIFCNYSQLSTLPAFLFSVMKFYHLFFLHHKLQNLNRWNFLFHHLFLAWLLLNYLLFLLYPDELLLLHKLSAWQRIWLLGLSTSSPGGDKVVYVCPYVRPLIFCLEQVVSLLCTRVALWLGLWKVRFSSYTAEGTTGWTCNGHLVCQRAFDFPGEVPGYGSDQTGKGQYEFRVCSQFLAGFMQDR